MASLFEDRLVKLEQSVGFTGKSSIHDISARLDRVAATLSDVVEKEDVLKQQLRLGETTESRKIALSISIASTFSASDTAE